MVWVDVDVDLADLDDEDIEAEYFRRKNINKIESSIDSVIKSLEDLVRTTILSIEERDRIQEAVRNMLCISRQ